MTMVKCFQLIIGTLTVLLTTLKPVDMIRCYECIHTTVTSDDETMDTALKKSMDFSDNEVSCMLGADTFEDNVPDSVECSWDIIHRQVLLSVRAGELKVEQDKEPLEVAYPGNRDNEYEFRCQKQRVDVTWAFERFSINVEVRTRGCQAVHIPEAIPNTCTYDMEAWMGEKFQEAVLQTHTQYVLEGELCFCDGNKCNSATSNTPITVTMFIIIFILGILL